MKAKLTQVIILVVALLAWLPTPASTQKINSLTATAKGQGTITVTDPGAPERKRPLYSG